MQTDFSINGAYTLSDVLVGEGRNKPLFCIIRYNPHVLYINTIQERTCFECEYEDFIESLELAYPDVEILNAYTVVDWRYEA